MKKYLLDTSLIAGYLLNRQKAVDLITPLIKQKTAATSMVVYGEVAEYVMGLASFPQYRYALQLLLEQINPYPLTYPILERYAELRRQMRQPRGRGLIGDIDTLIAATALENNLTVITIDRDFERVPELKAQVVDLKAR